MLYRLADTPFVRPLDTPRLSGALHAAPRIVGEVIGLDAFLALGDEWRDLSSCAVEPNAFFEPAFLGAADRSARAAIRIVLAWREPPSAARALVGCWVLRIARPFRSLPLRALVSPAIADYAFCGHPVLHRDHPEAALAAILDAIAAAPGVPKLMRARELAADTAGGATLGKVLAARCAPSVEIARYRRARLSSELDGPAYLTRSVSASTRKKLRQHRRRLEAQGTVALATLTGHEAVNAFEDFLRLEEASWKGRLGTAILCRDADAAFARTAFRALAIQGVAWIEALTVGDRIVATQVMLRSGSAAFTWKIAHDEAFAAFSPGVLLVESYTTSLLADPEIASVDSCSYGEDGMMASMWKERTEIADICFDARAGGSLLFRAFAAAARIDVCGRACLKEAIAATGLDPARVRQAFSRG